MIKYRKGYKYQLAETYYRNVYITGFEIDTEFIKLTLDGQLVILSGYSWDGPSGPAIDTDNFMEGSLVHDALYQLLRMSLISKQHRKTADLLLKSICRSKGMSKIRTWLVVKGVRWFASGAADPKNKKLIYVTN